MKSQKTYIDLHTHTNYSDGVGVNPKLNARMALINGIDILSITDHDHYAGYFKAKETAEEYGVLLIPGSELTTPDYHLLALNFNPNDNRFLDFLAESREIQKEKCSIRINRLRDHGIPITLEKVVERFPESRLGKYNVFIAMVEDSECRKFIEKECKDLRGLYKRFHYYMSRTGVSGELPDLGVSEEKAINEVHKAGGIIGIAHAPKDVKNISELGRLVNLGIDFFEIQPNQRSKKYNAIDYGEVERFAKERDIALTYGSDWHGPTFQRPFLEPGENVLSFELGQLLNKGYVKIPIDKLEKVCC